jgi:hypothetical protein
MAITIDMEMDFLTNEISLEADYLRAVVAIVEVGIKLGLPNEVIFSDIRAQRARQFCINCGRPSEPMYCPDCQSQDTFEAREARMEDARKRLVMAVLKAAKASKPPRDKLD